MAYEEHLADLIRARLSGEAGVDEKKMFGGLCWMLNGNMVCGVNGDRFLFRVGKERFDEALAWPGASLWKWAGGAPPASCGSSSDEAIDYGLDRMLDVAKAFVATLPPK